MADLVTTVKEATAKAIQDWYKGQETDYKAARARDRQSRKSTPKDGESWLEEYPLIVTHKGTAEGRGAVIQIRGCNRRFEVAQHRLYPMREHRFDGRKYGWFPVKNKKPRWTLRLLEPGVQELIGEASENFESLVQHAIIMMISHAYTESMLPDGSVAATQTARPRRAGGK